MLGVLKVLLAQKEQRKQHQVRAFDDEWDLIYRFAKLIKSGKIKACKVAVEKLGKSSID